jgi:Domain of unknown function (DUF4258)
MSCKVRAETRFLPFDISAGPFPLIQISPQVKSISSIKEFRIMANLHKIRQRIIERNYYLSSHAEEEMLNDDLERKDVENAILKGWIEKKMTRDVRGTRYRIEGPAMDGRLIHVLCRFREDTNLVIVTVYAL